MTTESIRLARLMSQRGLCSRREADFWIERGLVRVDGEIVSTLGVKVDPNCSITLEKEALDQQYQLVTVLLNKPIGYVSAQSEGRYQNASSLVTRANLYYRDRSHIRYQPHHQKNLAPAGRLDIDSSGLLVLTQDGRVAQQLISPSSDIEKEYLVRVEGSIDNSVMQRLGHGLELDARKLKPVKVTKLKPNLMRMVLVEGRKRQIRRMCDLVDLKVVGLKRVRIGKVRLGALPPGKWRYLDRNESF